VSHASGSHLAESRHRAHITVITVVVIAALIALALPAWRATRIDPTIALRRE
jgi:ABC-type antimicrobial peptide transport system permease subunit